MFKKSMLLFFFCVLALAGTGCTRHLRTLQLKAIDSMVLTPQHAGPGAPSFSLAIDVPHDQAVAAHILQWLNAAPIKGDGKGQLMPLGVTPTELEITCKDGTKLTLESAVGMKITQEPQGTLVAGQDIPGQVYVSPSNDHARYDIEAPELKAWLTGGWKQDFHIE